MLLHLRPPSTALTLVKTSQKRSPTNIKGVQTKFQKKSLKKVYEFLAYFTPTAFVQKPDALMLLLFSGPAVTLNHCTVDLVLESAPFAQQCVRMRSSQVFVVTCYKYIKVLVLVLVSSFSSYMLQIYKWMSLSARVDLMAV